MGANSSGPSDARAFFARESSRAVRYLARRRLVAHEAGEPVDGHGIDFDRASTGYLGAFESLDRLIAARLEGGDPLFDFSRLDGQLLLPLASDTFRINGFVAEGDDPAVEISATCISPRRLEHTEIRQRRTRRRHPGRGE
jgi:hypothetical protein